MLRDPGTAEVIGRAVLRHLEVERVDEVEVGYGVPTNRASQKVLLKADLVYEREITHADLPHVMFRTSDRQVIE
jgi:hypothetical protein